MEIKSRCDLTTCLLHQYVSARAHARTGSADWDRDPTRIRWKTSDTELTLGHKNLICTRRSQFHISLLPTLFWVLGARLVLVIFRFAITELRDPANPAFWFVFLFSGLFCASSECIYFPAIYLSPIFMFAKPISSHILQDKRAKLQLFLLYSGDAVSTLRTLAAICHSLWAITYQTQEIWSTLHQGKDGGKCLAPSFIYLFRSSVTGRVGHYLFPCPCAWRFYWEIQVFPCGT